VTYDASSPTKNHERATLAVSIACILGSYDLQRKYTVSNGLLVRYSSQAISHGAYSLQEAVLRRTMSHGTQNRHFIDEYYTIITGVIRSKQYGIGYFTS